MFPQVLRNVRVSDKRAVREDAAVQELLAGISAELGGSGRILLRESGTEPVVRIWVGGQKADIVKAAAAEIKNAVEKAAA